MSQSLAASNTLIQTKLDHVKYMLLNGQKIIYQDSVSGKLYTQRTRKIQNVLYHGADSKNVVESCLQLLHFLNCDITKYESEDIQLLRLPVSELSATAANQRIVMHLRLCYIMADSIRVHDGRTPNKTILLDSTKNKAKSKLQQENDKLFSTIEPAFRGWFLPYNLAQKIIAVNENVRGDEIYCNMRFSPAKADNKHSVNRMVRFLQNKSIRKMQIFKMLEFAPHLNRNQNEQYHNDIHIQSMRHKLNLSFKRGTRMQL